MIKTVKSECSLTVERTLREGEGGGSNPPAPNIYLIKCSKIFEKHYEVD